MKKLIPLTLTLVLLAVSLGIVQADEAHPEPYLLGSTKPLANDLKAAALEFLRYNPPAQPAPVYYFISNVSLLGNGQYRVSFIAYDLQSPDDEYDLEMHEKVIWFGALNITQMGEYIQVDYLFPPQQEAGALKLAAPSEAGGGTSVWFPWQAGKSVLYGVLGVHDTGYAGTRFVDLVSGDSMGPNAANSNVYASTNSTIVAICDDGQTVGIRMQTAGSGDYYSYYHLIPASLTEGNTFARGQLLGSLKYGSFSSQGCGSAQQQPTNYHLHWGFQPQNSKFRAEDCILDIGTQRWTCTQNGEVKTIAPTQWLWHAQGGNEPGVIINDNGQVVEPSAPSFWDMILIGMYSILKSALINSLPQKALFDTGAVMARAAMLVIRMFFVLVRSTFDIRLAMNIFLVIGLIETGLAIYGIYRLILKAIPGAS